VFCILNEATRQPVENPVDEVLRTGHVVGLANDTILVSKDGREIPIDDSAAPIRHGNGEIMGVVLIFRDVTQRRRAEAALKEADRRKDEFLATLSHELRNPLAPIRNALQILRLTDGNPAAVANACGILERQVRQMVRLVDDLLDVSRISRGKLDLRRERVELAEVVQEAVEISRPLIEAAGHELTVNLPPQPIYLHADFARLAQVFSNLLNNAAKYTERGGRIWLSAERTPPHPALSPPHPALSPSGGEGGPHQGGPQGPGEGVGSGEVLIRVRDTGIGIPTEMLARVFELFTQVDTSLERAQGGLGIGLTLVKSLVEMHNGEIGAHSQGPGQGSEFIVRLPLLAAEDIVQTAQPEAATARNSAKLQILVVDDNRDAADSLAMLLRLLGHNAVTAYEGNATLEQAAARCPDVVLLDIGLPGMDGYEVCQKLRGQGLCQTRIIALTGYGQQQDREQSLSAGFDAHLTKPVDLEALKNALLV
jgi:signal transduction histidine kinase